MWLAYSIALMCRPYYLPYWIRLAFGSHDWWPFLPTFVAIGAGLFALGVVAIRRERRGDGYGRSVGSG